ncbi:MAG: metalloregulator ArsR/SmtB family transcription factor [Pseudomonadales bacterium]|jgi:DNA-binding transcriptional ArsR family regulator|nr:metalloregulator ArsR/SmtB family transcription factor [Pseudomonadales bacterium]
MKLYNMPDTGQAELRSRRVLERAAGMLKAAGDPERMRILELLLGGPLQVSEIAARMAAGLPTTSQRLRLLLSEELVARERRGREAFYALADEHVRDLIVNVLDHAEPDHQRQHH